MANDLSSVFSGETAKPKASTFLIVLCILTIISSLIGTYMGIHSYFTADKTAIEVVQQKDKMKKGVADADSTKSKKANEFVSKMADSMKSLADPVKIRQNAIGSTLSNILTLCAAVLMLMLKRVGFYLYVLGTIAGIAIPLIIYGSGNMLTNIGAAFSGFFSIVFIIMYAFNLKDMKAAEQEVV